MLIIVGPSASGKTQIVQELIRNYHMKKLVTYTSRMMRTGEVNGIDYNFLSKEEFLKKINENFFLEYVVYNGNYYGTSFKGIDDDKVVILEPNGLKHYIDTIPSQIKVCYLTCASEILKMRMIKRGDDVYSVNQRIVLDKNVFNLDLKKYCNFVVDTSASNVYSCAELIYNKYRKLI